MELWIRSQDRKELIKANEISIESEMINRNETKKYFVDVNDYYFGTYKTKERALEVLNEIQKYILLPNTDNSAYVYEMPKE